MTQIHIDEAYAKANVFPLMVNFQNGYTNDNFTSQKCLLFENEKSNIKTLATELDGLVYAGDEETESLGKTFILARNNNTGKVRIIETEQVNLKPVFNIELNTSKLLEASNLELSRKFGSKKQKQRMEQKEKLKVNVTAVTEQMQNVTQAISEDAVDLASYNNINNDDFYVPPIDRNAEKVESVYDLNKILTEEQYENIYSELNEKDYTLDMLPFIKSIVTKNKLPTKCLILAVYADSLLKLYSTMVKEITKKSFTICPVSITLNNYILNNFLTTSNSKRTRPLPYKDKSLCHAVVFLLLINNYKLELDSLCEILKLTPTTATTKVRVTGASVVTMGSKKLVQLKLPLNKSGFKRRKSAKF